MGRLNKPQSEGYKMAAFQQKCAELIPPRLNKIDMNLVDLNYAKKSHYVYGVVGSGKTYHVCQMIKTLLYYKVFRNERIGIIKSGTSPDLLNSVKACFNHSAVTNPDQFISSFKTCRYLFIDDFGTEKVTDWVMEIFGDIINCRYENDLHLTITSNLKLEEIKGHLGERIYSRLNEMCNLVLLKGGDRRR